jgi:dolichol-phosphate mannosyltransferase
MQHFKLRDFAVEIHPLQLAIVFPTLNEAGNIAPLLDRVAIALADFEWEAIFVDDGSTDGTCELIEEIARVDRRVRLIRRVGRRGLSSAVMEGMLSSTAPVLAVMDADLQHDERILPELYRAVADEGRDLAIGTRYADGGCTGQWARHRVMISNLATRLAEVMTGCSVSDPMSGFFTIRRSALLAVAPRVSGIGYKVLLDILSSTKQPFDIAERPYTFGTREAGESKLDSAIVLQYLELLLEKTVGRLVPVRFIKFAMVGSVGVAVHMLILWSALELAALRFGVAQTVAVVGAMTFNYFLNNSFTYRDRRLAGLGLIYGLFSYYLVCSLGAVANVGVGAFLFDTEAVWWLAGSVGALVGSVWNYTMGSVFTWRARKR